MKTVTEFNSPIQFLLTDIDDTITTEGVLPANSYESLWKLAEAGIKVVPVTGRPAGWCEMIARLWPVHGIIGENGGFYFRYHEKKMNRHFVQSESERSSNRLKLKNLEAEILSRVPGCDLASDQFCRLMDLAIDFCEDVKPLPRKSVDQIVRIFTDAGAQAKVSSIHVNGWFGSYNKVSTSLLFLQKEFGVSASEAKNICAFSGDSPNDEPMFEEFPHSFAVANIKNFLDQIKNKPTYVATENGADGFVQIADAILKALGK